MEFDDWIRSGALLLSFLVAVISGRQIWMLVDMISCAVFGVLFVVFPKQLLQFQADAILDSGHIVCAQITGCCLIGSAVFWLLSRNSKDETVQVTMLISRVMSAGFLVMSMIQSQHATASERTARWNNQHKYFGILGATLWLVGNLFQLLRTRDWGGHANGNTRLDHHLRLDCVICTFGSFYHVAFSGMFVELIMISVDLDGIHIHLDRAVGAVGLGLSMITLLAPSFEEEMDKKAVMLGRTVTSLLILGVFVWHFHNSMPTLTQDKAMVAVGTLACEFGVSLNAVLSLFADGQKLKSE